MAKVVDIRRETKPIHLRLSSAKVRAHIARVVIEHQMDYFAACGRLLPATASRNQIFILADKIEKDARVQAAIHAHIQTIKLNDASFQAFFSDLQYWFKQRDNDRRWAGAARILAEVYGVGQRKDAAKAPSTLLISGFEAGVKRMFEDKPGAGPAATIEEEILQ